jgi:hypothetical protein
MMLFSQGNSSPHCPDHILNGRESLSGLKDATPSFIIAGLELSKTEQFNNKATSTKCMENNIPFLHQS